MTLQPRLPQLSDANAPGPSAPFDATNTPYDALGGESAVRGLVDTFYDHMDRDPLFGTIRALHPQDLTDSRQKLFEFLSGWLGGPQLYIQKHGHPRLRARHIHLPIAENEREQWLACMAKAMDERGVGGEVRSFLDLRFRHVADFLRNQ